MAFDFNGSDDLLTQDPSTPPSPFYAVSFHAWVRADQLTTFRMAVLNYTDTTTGRLAGISVRGGTNDDVVLTIQSSAVSYAQAFGLSTLPTDDWFQLGGIITATTLQVFLDGAQDAETVIHSIPVPTLSRIDIGARQNGASIIQFFDGLIEECAIWAGDIGVAGMRMLAKGAAPNHVRPDLLIEFWAMQRSLYNSMSGALLGTAEDTTEPSPSDSRGRVVIASNRISDALRPLFSDLYLATGAGDFAAPTGAGTGDLIFEATGDGTFPVPTGAGTGEEEMLGDGAGSLAAITGTGQGEEEFLAADGPGTFAQITGTGAGEEEFLAADGPGTLGQVTGAGVGDTALAEGTGAGTFGQVAGEGVGEEEFLAASGDGTLPVATGDGTGDQVVDGTGAGTFAVPLGTGVGELEFTATGDGLFAVATGTGVGSVPVEGTAAGTFPVVVGAGTGSMLVQASANFTVTVATADVGVALATAGGPLAVAAADVGLQLATADSGVTVAAADVALTVATTDVALIVESEVP